MCVPLTTQNPSYSFYPSNKYQSSFCLFVVIFVMRSCCNWVFHNVTDNSISCLNGTYIFLVFSLSVSDLWNEHSSMKSKVKDILSDLIFQQVTFHLRFTIMDFEIIFGFDFWFGFGTLSPFLQFGICLQYFASVLALMGLALFSYIISILIKLCQSFILRDRFHLKTFHNC